MKTPEEIKKWLAGCTDKSYCQSCYNEWVCKENEEALTYIRQLESTYSQVNKALCGKENATLDEVLQAVSQVKTELEVVKRERDAAVYALESIATGRESRCAHCVHSSDVACFVCWGQRWQWRGVCPENTEVQDDG